MTTVLASLTADSRKDECIKHALAVRAAWALNNYHSLFRLYKSAPKMSGYLMDWFAERARKIALKAIVKSYVLLVFLHLGREVLGWPCFPYSCMGVEVVLCKNNLNLKKEIIG